MKKYWWIVLFITFILVSYAIKQLTVPFSDEILKDIESSITNTNIGLLVMAAVKSVIYESINDLFVYIFAYSFTFYYLKGNKLIYKVILAPILTIVLYTLNMLIHGSITEYAILFFIICCELILLIIFDKHEEYYLSSIFIFIQLNFAFYSLLITTILNDYKVGYRDLITSIKISSDFLGSNTVLNFVSLSLFIPLIIGSILLILLTILYSRRLASEKREKEKERELRLVKSVAEEARIWQELHYLVHDLKSPLMTVSGLTSLIKLQVNNNHIKDYCKKVESAVDNVNDMISEFLNNEKRRITAVEELLKIVRAHVVVKGTEPNCLFEIEKDLPLIKINRIRMARALINVIENAIRAVKDREDPQISVQIYSNQENELIFIVKDNGVGIATEDLKKIWNIEFTTKSSTGGLGMSFVKKVIENHQGEISISSNMGNGTEVMITLPGVKDYE
ncbi:MAG: hypothetical protein APF76_06950 [Desulfitibacter sp. BRH_c19]|nr:MAG: hypothetical protein APF76_06950 [Desulfitibacter sp. BRH_c19]